MSDEPEAVWTPAVVLALKEDGGTLTTLANCARHLEGLAALVPSATWVAVPVPAGREPGAFARSVFARSTIERFDRDHNPEGAGNDRGSDPG